MNAQADDVVGIVRDRKIELTARRLLESTHRVNLASLVAEIPRAVVPRKVVLALLLLETEHRPPWFQRLEGILLRTSLWLFRIGGTPILNLSVGPGQVKVSTGLRHLLGTSVSGRLLLFDTGSPMRTRVWRATSKLLDPQSNVNVAAAYVCQILLDYCRGSDYDVTRQTALSEGFLRFLSATYTGQIQVCSEAELVDLMHAEILIRLVNEPEL